MSDQTPEHLIVLKRLEEVIDYRTSLTNFMNPSTPDPEGHEFHADFERVFARGVFPSGENWTLTLELSSIIPEGGHPLTSLETIAEEFKNRLNSMIIRDFFESLVRDGIGSMVQPDIYKCSPKARVPDNVRDFFAQYGILVVD